MPIKQLFKANPNIAGSAILENLPLVLHAAFRKYLGDAHDYADITVSSLDTAVKPVALHPIARKLTDPAQAAKDWLAAIIGTAMHKWIEEAIAEPAAKDGNEAGSPQWLIEHHMIIPFTKLAKDATSPVVTATLGGTCDLYDIANKTLYDYKVVPEFSLGKKAKDYGFQQNAYRVMLAKLGFPEPQRMCLIEFARDWSDPEKGSQKAKRDCPIYIEEVPRDDNVTVELLIQLARERLHYRDKAREHWTAAKPTKAKAEQAAYELAKTLPPCQSEYTHTWGVLPTGIPRRCMYCTSRVVCDQVKT